MHSRNDSAPPNRRSPAWSGAGTEPSYERVADAVRACGLELVPQLLPADDADWSVASTNLMVGPDARVRRHQAGAPIRDGRAARR